jgi:hypothetical protein
MDKVKLKPCPFCGEDQPFVFEPSCHKDAVYDPRDRAYPLVRCRDCLASVDGENWDHSCRTAIDKWNTRALEAENAALKSSVLSEWVPVSVRLPDKACMVVVALPGMGMLMQCRVAIYMDGSFSYPSSDQKVRDARYWMPINPPMNSEA